MRAVRLLGALVASFFFLLSLVTAGVAFHVADKGYDEAGRRFDAAAYEAECSSGAPSAGTPGCEELGSELEDDPPVDQFGVPLTDARFITALATTTHATATASLTIAGLALAVGSTSLTLALFMVSWHREARARRRTVGT